MNFAFDVFDVGWAMITLGVTEFPTSSFRVSHVSDALGDLVDAVAAVCVEYPSQRLVVWNMEPAVVRCLISRAGKTNVHLLVESNKTDNKMTRLFDGFCTTEELLCAVVVGCEGIDRHKFATDWPIFPFPEEGVTHLRQLWEQQDCSDELQP